MRVLHVTETVVGGVGSHLAELLPLQVRDFGPGSVTLIYPRQMQSYFPSIDGLETIFFEHSGKRFDAARALASVTHIEAKKQQPAIIHAHSSFAGLATRIPYFGVRGIAPIVYCPHGWSFAQDVSTIKKRFYIAVERLLMAGTAGVVNVSEHEKSLAVKSGLPAHKLHVITNGIASEEHVSQQIESEVLPELPPEKLHLLFVGRFDRAKGIDILVDAAREIDADAVHFHVIGAPMRIEEDVLPTQLESLTSYGWQSRAFVFAMLKRVDALVMPSRWEGMPMIGIEAFREGLPIIASNKSAIPELVEDGVSGRLVDIDQPGALAKCIRELSKESLQVMGVCAKHRFETRFTIERQHSEITALYHALTR